MTWQPIETAPQTGESILVYAGGDMYVVRWWHDYLTGDWWYVDDNKCGPFALRGPSPTHWQPLPAPPAAAE